ncbi:MAG: hypothetical protein A2Y13_05365 [Planctomycetes bacterium GWC2_45_44]|nr:MAG: hypothetical protein A2Y13_05365 [Planctomycetes bacterium GWC2_45_44]
MPRYPCQPVIQTPKIDGILDEQCWTQLPSIGAFVNGSYTINPVQTTVMLGYDSNNLYLGIRLDEPFMDKIVTNKTEHDSGIWQDDDLEFFIAATPGAEVYFQFCINSKGTTEECRDIDIPAQWNGNWQSAAKSGEDCWTVEMAIPFKTLGEQYPNDGTVWRMNICRNRVGASNISSWSGTNSFTDRERFGEVIFLKQRLLQSIHSSLKQNPKTAYDLPPENELNFIIQAAVSGNYKIRYNWFDNKEMVRDAISHIKADKPTQFTERFPLSENLVLGQIELFSTAKPAKVLYRSERMSTGKYDIRVIMLANAEKLVNKLSKQKTPALLDGIKNTWQGQLKVLDCNSEKRSIEKLLHECRIVEWLIGLDCQWQSKTAMWFSLPPFTSTDYDYIPNPCDIGGKVSITAMRGEYEPGCVNVLMLDAGHDVILKINNLLSDAGDVLDCSNIDIRVLKYWYQAGTESEVDKAGNVVWTGELLLKNDSIIDSDHNIQRNIVHSIADSPYLKSVHISRFQSRQFWLTAYIPKEQKPGLYRGYAEAMSGDVALARIPVEIKVLPLSIEPSKFTSTMYYLGRYSNGKDPNNDACYQEDLRVAADHGFTSMPILEGADARMKDGFVISYDFTVIRKALELRKKYGLTGKTVYWGNNWYTQPLDLLCRISEEQLVSESQHKANLIKFCKELSKIAAETGIDFYFYTWDEPGYDSTGKAMRMCRIMNQWTHEGNMKTAVAIDLQGAKELGNLDLPVLDMPSGVISEQRRKLPYDEAWFYWHPLENTMPDRLLSGLMIWYGGYTGSYPYAYNALGDWDDWEGDFHYRPMHYAYRGESGPVLTWQYEAFREGRDDVRYLEMLEKRVKQAEKIGFDTFSSQDKKFMIQAKNLLDVPPEKFVGGARSLPLKLTAMDFYQFRQMTAEMLVKADDILARKRCRRE